MRYLLTLFAFLIACSAAAQSATKWEIKNPHKAVSFKIGSLFGKVDGSLQQLSGDIYFSPDDLDGSRFDVELPVATLDTDNDKRDEHLMKGDWFHQDKFPKIHFMSERIEQVKVEGQTGYIAHGKLEIHGIRHEADLPFTFEPSEAGIAVFEGALRLNRLNFGVGEDDFKVKDLVDVDVMVVGKKR